MNYEIMSILQTVSYQSVLVKEVYSPGIPYSDEITDLNERKLMTAYIGNDPPKENEGGVINEENQERAIIQRKPRKERLSRRKECSTVSKTVK